MSKDVFTIFGDEYSKRMVWFALYLLPLEVATWTVDNYAFICQNKASDGSHWLFRWDFFKGKIGVIILDKRLWRMKKIKAFFIIAHEIAHAWKKHENPDLANKKLIRKLEREADVQAVEWLSTTFKRGQLLKICKQVRGTNLK